MDDNGPGALSRDTGTNDPAPQTPISVGALPIRADTNPIPTRPGTPKTSNTTSSRQVPPCPGWNPGHGHNTRFKSIIQVNLSYMEPTSTSMIDLSLPVIDQHTAMVSNIEDTHTLDDGAKKFTHPWALHNDVLHYGDMLQADDCPKFVAAMENKIKGLRDMLEVVPRSTIPEGSSILPTIWAFKKKRLPAWSILKHKARLNMHGGRQTLRVNY